MIKLTELIMEVPDIQVSGNSGSMLDVLMAKLVKGDLSLMELVKKDGEK